MNLILLNDVNFPETGMIVHKDVNSPEGEEIEMIEEADLKCTRQFAQSARTNAKFHSNPQEKGLYTAETGSRSTKSQGSFSYS